MTIARAHLEKWRYELLFKYRLTLLYEGVIRVKNWIFGETLRIDVTSICQLKCPVCLTAQGATRENAIGWGRLKFEDFKQLIDENPQMKTVELSNWGEMFLNPDLDKLMKLAHERKIRLRAQNGTNFNFVRRETLENLVKYRFRDFRVSLDGATQETYAEYRMNGNIENVLNNIRKLNEHKKNYRSKYPRLTWQFVIFGHNEHELPLAKKMARELGMDFWPKLNHDPVYSPVKDKELVKRESGLRAASRTEFKEIRKRDYNFPCAHLWEDPQINWDGKLLGCSVNVWDDFGDVFQDELKKTLNGERFKYAKAMVLGKVAVRKDIPCCNCSIYKNLPFAKTNSESTGAWAFSSLRNRR